MTMPLISLSDLLAKSEAATPRGAGYELMRYEHGGGRACVILSDGRTLIADLYHEGDREFFAAASPDVVRALVGALLELGGGPDYDVWKEILLENGLKP